VEVLTMKELLETGVHFGHQTRKWNPKMARYIFTERKGIHIIDLEQTVGLFKKAYFFVRDNVGEGKEILFVGTKKQVQMTIVDEAKRCGAHYVNRRWLGGTLTNFATIKQSIKRMKDLETLMEDGSIDHFPNKEASRLRRDLAKLKRNLDGLRNLERVPDILYVIDPDVETNAIREAKILKIPVLAIVDTNCDPDPIDFPIPGNDDAIKATKLITSRIADAVLEGREGTQTEEATAEEAVASEETAAETTVATEAVVAEAVVTSEETAADETVTTEEVVVEDAASEPELAVETAAVETAAETKPQGEDEAAVEEPVAADENQSESDKAVEEIVAETAEEAPAETDEKDHKKEGT